MSTSVEVERTYKYEEPIQTDPDSAYTFTFTVEVPAGSEDRTVRALRALADRITADKLEATATDLERMGDADAAAETFEVAADLRRRAERS